MSSEKNDDEAHELTAIRTNVEEDDEFITVAAPSNLPGGYELDVESDDMHWTVQVVCERNSLSTILDSLEPCFANKLCRFLLPQPEGGVNLGETFRGLLINKVPVAKAKFVALSMQEDISSFEIPTGKWRDGIFDCCTHGICHAQWRLTLRCPHIALGQLMTRLNLNACGKPASTRLRGLTSPFFVMIFLTLCFPVFARLPGSTLGLLIYIMVIHTRTRNGLRRKYKIGTSYGWLGDCCCAFWCFPCSVCQMARHTADYRHRHRARRCTETGLDEDVEPLGAPPVLTASVVQIV
jgi:Cys-rich protein (TIGR01571 family)